MKPRMSVARCCCLEAAPQPPQPGPERNYIRQHWGWWEVGRSFIFNDPQTTNAFLLGRGTTGAAFDTPLPVSAFLIYDVDLPQGFTIFSAELYVELVSSPGIICTDPGSQPRALAPVGAGCQYNVLVRARAYAEDADTATEYTTVAGIEAAARTGSTFRSYNVASGFAAGDAYMQDGDVNVFLADVTQQVQAVLNRPGWVSGNSMQFFVEEDGSDWAPGQTLPGYENYIELPYDVNEMHIPRLRIIEPA